MPSDRRNEWDDPPGVEENEDAGDPGPFGGFMMSTVGIGYSMYLLWVGEYALMLLALLASMAFYLGVVTIQAAREDAI